MTNLENYREQITKLQQKITHLTKKETHFSIARLLSFLGFVTALIFGIGTGQPSLILLTLLLAGAFIISLRLHLNNREKLNTTQTLKEILENEIACLKLQSNTYYDGDYFKDPDHNFSYDMDVFGPNSLFRYVNRCATATGNHKLAHWLSDHPKIGTIQKRQQAVQELAQHPQWCQNLRTMLYPKRIRQFQQEFLPEIKNTIASPRLYSWLVAASYTLLAMTLTGIIFMGLNPVLLTLPVFFNIILGARTSRFIKTIKAQLEGREKTLNEYLKILTSFEGAQWDAPLLKQMQARLLYEQTNASGAVQKLKKLSAKLDYSLNMMVGAVLNFFFLWDLVMCIKISKWFQKWAHKTSDWFAVIGETEALISMANLQNNHPGWSYPTVKAGPFSFQAQNLGHPLIAENERVCNDYQMQNPQTLSIITGSNMAGKSTFLRTLGVNIILAHAGAVVCAQNLNMSHFRIMTYLTITDSLTESTSTFYREIQRLKKILNSAREDNNILLLLDELLRGTNSADKARGSMAIVRELVSRTIPALIATHNLELAEMKKDHPGVIENYYFDIIIDSQNQMRFDYKLKPGVCDTFNATLLLREIGIEVK